jgi:flagellin
MISIQTNIDSLVAQQNLNLDNQFQSTTIQQLTSGYRINKSGDDAAGLAVANGINSDIAQLTQGVNNASNGLSQLEIVDGGLSNISTILNRLQTLATESASATFTGSRVTLNQEYSGLLSEITRQASNINLNQGGSFNQDLSVFIGGGSSTTNSTVSINLSGDENGVDATSLGLANTNVLGAGTGFTGNTQSLNDTTFLASNASESFTFNAVVNGTATTQTITVTGSTDGISGSAVIAQLNEKLGAAGLQSIVATQSSTGELEFSSTDAFNVTDNAGSNSVLITPTTTAADYQSSNAVNYVLSGGTTLALPSGSSTETLTFQQNGQTIDVTLNATNSATTADAIATINAATGQYGIYALANPAGDGIDFQSANTFTVADSGGATTDVLGVASTSAQSPTYSPTTSSGAETENADRAITAINAAIAQLGLTQGIVGAGENTLNYAINLAQSQITNFSSEESSIKDADIATSAANLSKSQVLEQTAVAALAQANAEPQAILKLLQ